MFAFSVVIIFVFGVVSSYSDIRHKKVYNRQIVVFGFVGIIISVANIIGNPSLLFLILFNIVFSVALSVVFYAVKIWAAGDSKMFIVMLLLMPHQLYNSNGIINLTSFCVLCLAFLCAVLYISIENIYLLITDIRTNSKKGIITKKNLINKSKFHSALLAIVSIDTYHSLLNLDVIRFSFNPLFNIAVCFLLSFSLVSGVKKERTKIISIISLLTLKIIVYFALDYFSFMIIRSVLIVFVAMLIKELTNQYNYKEILISELKTGDVLSFGTIAMMMVSKVKDLPRFTDESTRSRLSEVQVNAIKRWEHTKYGQSSVTIVRTISFAPFIFLGSILYFVLQYF